LLCELVRINPFDNPITLSIDANIRRSAPSAAVGNKIAFRTRSEDEEVLDDGYKWRKYGKKSVKNSPSPRYGTYVRVYST
jgi:hypothetical protein